MHCAIIVRELISARHGSLLISVASVTQASWGSRGPVTRFTDASVNDARRLQDQCDGVLLQWRIQECEKGGGGAQVYVHGKPETILWSINGEPPSEASEPRKGGAGVLRRKISKTYIANGAIYVIPELYLWILLAYNYCNKTCINYASFITI